MSDRSERLVGRLRTEGDSTVAFFLAIGEEDWMRTVYSEGASWTIHEILTHFLGSEVGVARLIELIVMGEAGAPEDFDLDGYNERKVNQLKKYDPAHLLDRFSEARSRTISIVRGFSDADLDREGRHPFLGVVKVEEMVQLMYRHNKLHQRDIRRVLAGK